MERVGLVDLCFAIKETF